MTVAGVCLGFGMLATAPICSAAPKGAYEFSTYEQKPDAWFGTPEARDLAEHLLLFQNANGGWPKNRIMTLTPAEEAAKRKVPDDETLTTIDNGATTGQLQFIARVHARQPDPRYQAAIERGIDYLLAAQYGNGGWPQFFPLREGYYTHITFNDDAMADVLELLRDVARQTPPFAGLDAPHRTRAGRAVEKGIACILRCQIRVDGRLTAWCAQHDEKTFAPAPARKYEHVSLSGLETVGIVRFLMGEESPSPGIIAAVHAAAAWLKSVQLSGLRVEQFPADTPTGVDRRIVADPSAPPLWARFYEIGTNKPIFSGRDSIVRYALAEIEAERRGGYNWYVKQPRELLEKEYPAWARKWPAPPGGGTEFSLDTAEKKVREKYPDITRPSAALPQGVVASENLTYAVVDGQILQLDIYRPEGIGPYPIVLIVHGGGWETGSRHMERPFARQLAARGYIAVPVSYRLGKAGQFPGALNDLQAAIRWLRAHAVDLALEGQKVGVLGGSAGGQLAALLGAMNRDDIGAVVDIDGLADFTSQALLDQQAAQPSAPVRFLGGSFADKPEVWRAASAITHVSKASAPTLFINSTVTSPILPGREAMRDKLRAAGVASDVIVVPDTPHPFWLFNPWFDRVLDESDQFLRRHLAVPPPAGPTLHLVGDSTMANKKDPGYPERGWGQPFRAFVPASMRLVNHAVNGRSTKSIRDTGAWQTMLNQLKSGDWVVIEFGHNDEKQHDPALYADAATAYPANLRRFVAEVRAQGANPVLATPVCRRDWAPDGTLRDTHGAYLAAVKQVAAEEKVPLLDLEAVTRKLLVQLGPEASQKLFLVYAPGEHPAFPAGKTDNTHYNEEGARRVAALVAAEMRARKLPFADTLSAGK